MRKLILALLLVLMASPAYARYVLVSWDAVAGATSYTLYWGAESGMETWTYSLDVELPDPLEYQLPINEETTYMVVTATDGTGEGPASNEYVFVSVTQTVSSTGISGAGFSLR